jgi:hypothetical protein
VQEAQTRFIIAMLVADACDGLKDVINSAARDRRSKPTKASICSQRNREARAARCVGNSAHAYSMEVRDAGAAARDDRQCVDSSILSNGAARALQAGSPARRADRLDHTQGMFSTSGSGCRRLDAARCEAARRRP